MRMDLEAGCVRLHRGSLCSSVTRRQAELHFCPCVFNKFPFLLNQFLLCFWKRSTTRRAFRRHLVLQVKIFHISLWTYQTRQQKRRMWRLSLRANFREKCDSTICHPIPQPTSAAFATSVRGNFISYLCHLHCGWLAPQFVFFYRRTEATTC